MILNSDSHNRENIASTSSNHWQGNGDGVEGSTIEDECTFHAIIEFRRPTKRYQRTGAASLLPCHRMAWLKSVYGLYYMNYENWRDHLLFEQHSDETSNRKAAGGRHRREPVFPRKCYLCSYTVSRELNANVGPDVNVPPRTWLQTPPIHIAAGALQMLSRRRCFHAPSAPQRYLWQAYRPYGCRPCPS